MPTSSIPDERIAEFMDDMRSPPLMYSIRVLIENGDDLIAPTKHKAHRQALIALQWKNSGHDKRKSILGSSDHCHEFYYHQVVAIYTPARFVPGKYHCSIITCLHLTLPRSEIPSDDIRSRTGTILTFYTSQPLDDTQLNRLIKESMHAFRTRRNAGRSAILTEWDLSREQQNFCTKWPYFISAPYYSKWSIA